jgi:hypothetical protein
MSGSKTISNITPAVGAVNIQQSSYGLVLPIVWGRTRITGNLIWYGDFKASPHTETTQSGGKGGAGGIKQSTTTYTYSAAVMMALAEGPITGIRNAWRGKSFYSGIPTSNQMQKTSEIHTYAAHITVANTTAWADVSVQVSAPGLFGNEVWVSLLRGVDYSATSGVYTINATVMTPAGTISMAGRDVQITYTYSSMTPGETALGALGLDLTMGTPAQAPWSYLTTNFPLEAVGYSSVAYVMGAEYSLTGSAEVDNHSFEVDAPAQFSDVGDAIPSDVVFDFLSNPQYGATFGSDKIGGLTDYKNACIAQGIFVSPALTQQAPAIDFLAQMAQLTNVGMVWSEGVLKFIPYTDTAIAAHSPYYVGFTPNTTPIYDLTDDDFISSPGEDPIKVSRSAQTDTFNCVKIEFLDRGNFYNIAIAEAKDQADIQESGLRVMSTISAHWICDVRVARIVAQLILQRSMFIRNTYDFKVGWNKVALEPMDLVTLTDDGLGLAQQPVRIISIDESESGELAIVAEEFPKGSASATMYPSGSGNGFAHNYNADPGNAAAPVIFEAPVSLAQSTDGLDIWLATGGGPMYGGCEIWTSLTGANYERVAALNGSSRFGVTTTTLAAHSASGVYSETVGVHLTSGGQIIAGTTADMNSLTTLCYIGGEFLSYEGATLTGVGAYTLGPSLNRGGYLSGSSSQASGSAFVRCDAGIAKFPLTADYIGKTIHVKLRAYNIYGGALQDLSAVADYTYTITGIQANNPPIAPTGLALEGAFTINTAKFKWDRIANAVSYNVQIWAGSTLAMVRQVNVGNALRYDYSFADATTDGGPWRNLTIKVQGINKNGAAGPFATLAVSNPQVGALTGTQVIGGASYLQFNCAKPGDPDFAGIRIWISTTAGFTPTTGDIVFDGPATNYTISSMPGGSPIASGTDYYVKFAGYDSFDKNSLTIGAIGPVTTNSGATGNQAATAYLYMWSTVTPSAPTGTSTFTWATGANSAYSGSDGWGTSIPANSGAPGLTLFVATKPISAAIGTATSTVSYSTANVAGWSQNGAPGAKSATATAYKWSATGAPTATGTATWTWATASYNTPPSTSWSISIPASPGQGYTLYQASYALVDTTGATTSSINWTSATIQGIGYTGSNGGSGSNGVSATVAYALVTGNPTISAPASVTVAGTGLPAYNSWGQGETWQSSVPVPAANQSVFMSNGLYNSTAAQTVWNLPYLAALKVGSLSALTVNTGTLTVDTAGYIQGGQSGYNSGAGFFLGYSGGVYKFSIGNGSGKALTWDGSTFTLTGAAINIGGGNFQVNGSTGSVTIYDLTTSNIVGDNTPNPTQPAISAKSINLSSQPAIKAIAGAGDAITATGPITMSGRSTSAGVTSNGSLSVTSGGISVSSGGLTVSAGGLTSSGTTAVNGSGTSYGGYFTAPSGAGLYCSGFQALQINGAIVHTAGSGTANFNSVVPNANNTYQLGASGNVWSSCWVQGGVFNGSDIRIKYDVRDSDLGRAFINKLRSRVYKMRVGATDVKLEPEQAGPGIDGLPIPQQQIVTTRPGVRDHHGFITQELREALGTDNAGMWVLADKNDPDSAQFLNYQELIAPIVRAIQEIDADLQILKNKG